MAWLLSVPSFWRSSYLVLVIFLSFLDPSSAQLENIYCGREDCYKVLQVDRDATTADIKKAYRRLARKFHPDKYKGEDAEERFQQIATAYETLKDEETRRDYDYMLDNPDELYGHYYRYYRRRVTPKVDLRVVIAVSITIVSILQYLHGWQRYNEAISYALSTPQYRMKAKRRAMDEGLLTNLKKGKKSKEQLKAEEESILRQVVENSLDIRGGYSKPKVQDVLWVQIVFSPYYLVMYVVWLANWYWRFTIKRQPYDDEAKEYLTRKQLKLSQTKWESMPETEQANALRQEIWIKENFKAYKQEQEQQMKEKMAENSRYKQYRRYMKNHGPGRISFLDEE